nr:uncharacterized protein LOC123767303 [Procambarus clarkii]
MGLAQLTAEKCETLRSELENKISYCTADKTKDDGDSSAKKLSDNGKNEIEGEAASQVKCNTEKPFVSSLRQFTMLEIKQSAYEQIHKVLDEGSNLRLRGSQTLP